MGGLAAGASVPSPETPKEHEDDKTCPYPESQCKDWGGRGQMCTTGQNPGCEFEIQDPPSKQEITNLL